MFKGEIVPFDNRPNYIRASNGYLYGLCSRLYHFAYNTGQIGITPELKEDMNRGTENHIKIQKYLKSENPSGIIEDYNYITIGDYPVYSISRHLDFLMPNTNIAIEIKPRYSIGAYFQILIQKLISPEYQYYMYCYDIPKRQNRYLEFFNVYPTLKMAKIYLSRILTAREVLTPIPSKLKHTSKVCNNCLFYEYCYPKLPLIIKSISWLEFKMMSHQTYRRLWSITP